MSKLLGGVQALDSIDFELDVGEVQLGACRPRRSLATDDGGRLFFGGVYPVEGFGQATIDLPETPT